MQHHLKYTNIHSRTKKITENFFAAKPWSGSRDDRHAKFEEWLERTCAVYDIVSPSLVVSSDPFVRFMSQLYTEGDVIAMANYSVIGLFHAFYHRLQVKKGRAINCRAAHAWACSLYYSVRPKAFIKAVVNGKINDVFPADVGITPDHGAPALTDDEAAALAELQEELLSSLENDDPLHEAMEQFEMGED